VKKAVGKLIGKKGPEPSECLEDQRQDCRRVQCLEKEGLIDAGGGLSRS
jgi:hypothetical protein